VNKMCTRNKPFGRNAIPPCNVETLSVQTFMCFVV
jgi:hypothetical protein